MAAGVAIWALHFTALYGITTLACARGMPGVVPWAIGGATAVAAALALGVVARSFPRRADFIHWMAATVAALALIAIVWEALPALWLSACGRTS
jgi:hypothetical protein